MVRATAALMMVAAACCWPSLSWADEGTVNRRLDVVYGKGGDADLKLDVVSPAGKGPFPAVVVVHGGGWRAGSKRDGTMRKIADRLAENGYVAISVQYRLAPTARFPAQIEDCKCAVRWLRAHAKDLRIDPGRIGAIGGSAGGHLVLLLGLTSKSDGLEGKGDLDAEQAAQSSAVQAVVNIFGPTDLVQGDWNPQVEPLIVDLIGGAIADKKETARAASPLTYINSRSSIPPILTFHGTEDQVVPFVHAEKLHAALKEAKSVERLIAMQGEKHGWSGEKMESTLKQTVEFFDAHLKSSGASR